MNLADGWQMVEIFAHVSKSWQYSPAIVEAGRLFPPILLIGPKEFFTNWRWEIVHSNPGYVPPDLGSLRYVMGTPGRYRLVKVNDYQPLPGIISDGEAELIPEWKFATPEVAESQIKEALQEKRLL
jgi:hypothetical protein